MSINFHSPNLVFIVNLIDNSNIKVGMGKVMKRALTVHGHLLEDTEVKLMITEVKPDITHPSYGYPIEKGGFCAWNIQQVVVA